MKHKLLSILLSLFLVISLLSAVALAAEGTTGDGTQANPYTLTQLSAMTRDEYIAAQGRLDGTMYVTVGEYTYDKNGTLGNGERNDTPGQTENRSVLNGYNSNGYLGEKNDGANGKNIVFVGGTITSGVTGYTSIDNIGTSLLLAVPAYTNVTFKGTTFKNVFSFNYQLYTGPWSQLGELKFDGCTFNGIIVGAIAAQKLTFDGCTFTDYTNLTSPNNSNPTWIRPAYGNWTKGDNEGQGGDFRSLTKINFTGNTVTSTRPVKFERISQWDITSTVTATGNSFDISAQSTDKANEVKNVGLYLGAYDSTTEFNLVADRNTKSENTAALYTVTHNSDAKGVGLPAGSTVKDSKGNDTTLTDALKWKGDPNDVLTLKTTYADTAVAGINGVSYDSLDDAITAAQNGDTITVLKAAGGENGYKLNGSLTYSGKAITIKAADGVDVKFDMSAAVALHGAKITFEGVTFKYDTANYIGLQHTDTLVYNNCTIDGQVFLYANSETFNGCTFNQTSKDAYNVWTYGAKNVEFNDCTFNCAGKSVLVYNEGTNKSTNLVVEDSSFNASEAVDGKAAIEIDTSLMAGGATVTVDEKTKDQVNGFGTGSNSKNSLWNDKKQTAETNKNTTVVVAGKTVFEPTCINLDAFLKMVESSGYAFDGTRADGTKLTVKWSPVSGCFDLSGGHHQLGVNCPNVAATGNTPNRLQDPYAQYQLFASATGLSISNVNFVYVPAKVSVCMNGSWGGKDVTPTLAELQLKNSGDTTFTGCTFDKVTVSPFGKGNDNGNTNEQNTVSFTGCEFANVTDKYAIKDVYAGNVTVENCTFTNCGGGIYLEGKAKKGIIDISGNTFTNIGTKGLIQFSANGDYTNADITIDGNTATNCGPILRQLNQGIADNDVLSTKLKGDLTGLGGKLTFTGDSVKKTGETEPAQPTIYTVKFSGSDVADKKVVSGTTIDLPTATKSGYTFKGWKLGTETKQAGDKVTISADTTFTAVWQSNSSGSSGSYYPTYSVSTPSKTENGTVTISPKYANKGDTVTITVKPDSGYVLGSLTVTDSNGNRLPLTAKGNGTYTFVMPDGRVEVKATFTKEAETSPFADVATDAYCYEAVKWAVGNGITTGVGGGLFAPAQPCTRAQIVTFLWRAAGSPEPNGTAAGMTDVISGSYYEKAVAWAIENGITTGTTATTFSPDDPCTRAQAVTFLARALHAEASGTANFRDVPANSYFANAVAWAAANGVAEGVGSGLFAPDSICTRGQIVTFLFRAYSK